MTMIVVGIHNARVGTAFEVDGLAGGRLAIKKLAENKLQRILNDQENESLQNELEIYSDDDMDNVWSYSLVPVGSVFQDWIVEASNKDVSHE
jgi:hypothetical protein